ncbi:MAG: AbrB/MazE/SpoVT family DNA-binding domain-containing protein [Candidatus Aminicenantales bacterium]
MKTHVQKWGNSLAVRIPKSFADDLDLENNSSVEMSLEEGAVVIKPDRDKDFDLEALLAGVTDENIHPAWEKEDAASDNEEVGEGRP